jgi:hypothetical protein
MEPPKKVNGKYTIPPEPNRKPDSPFLESEIFTAETRSMEAEGKSSMSLFGQESPFLDAFESELQEVVVEPVDEGELESEEMYDDIDEYVEEEMESENFDESFDELDDESIVDSDDEAAGYERELEVEDEDFIDKAEDMECDECLEDETPVEYRAREAEIEEQEALSDDPEDEAFEEEFEEELAETGAVEEEEAWETRGQPEYEEIYEDAEEDESQETRSGRTGQSLRDRIVMAAEKEWERWNRGNLRETDDEALKILADYYRTAVGERKNDKLGDRIWHSNKPWSAVFISWVMKTAGSGKNFRYSRGHHYYIAAAKRNKLKHKVNNPFWAYPITEIAPQPGDLVCNRRANSGATYDNIHDLLSFRSSHVDIVTEVRPYRLIVVGGNTSQRFPRKGLGANTVGKKTIQTDDRGFILQRKKNQFFAIIKVRDEEPGEQPGTLVSTSSRIVERAKKGKGDRLIKIKMARAVRLNRYYGKKLGWHNRQKSIERFLGFTNNRPGEKTFVRAVADWQKNQRLEIDGVIGPNTWKRLKTALKTQKGQGIDPDRAARKGQIKGGKGKSRRTNKKSKSDFDIDFSKEETTVPNRVKKNIRNYVDKLDSWFDNRLENYQDALAKFFITVKSASIKDAKPDVLGAMLSTIFEFEVKSTFSELNKAFNAPVGSALGLIRDLALAARDEMSRAGRAEASKELGDWLKSQYDAIGKARDSFSISNIQEEMENRFLEAEKREEFLDELFRITKVLSYVKPPSNIELERRLYEQWINAHFYKFADDASGYIELRAKDSSDGIELVSFTVSAPEGDKIADALNRIGATTWNLKVRKRLCFWVENLAGGHGWFCGWLDKNNEVIHMPIIDRAADLVRNISLLKPPPTRRFFDNS